MTNEQEQAVRELHQAFLNSDRYRFYKSWHGLCDLLSQTQSALEQAQRERDEATESYEDINRDYKYACDQLMIKGEHSFPEAIDRIKKERDELQAKCDALSQELATERARAKAAVERAGKPNSKICASAHKEKRRNLPMERLALTLLALLAAASCGAQTNQWLHTADNPASLPAFPEWNMTNRDKATVLSTLRHEWELEAVERLWTLTYTTNVVESDNHQGCQYYAKDVMIWPVPSDYGPYIAPTERTWTTNVTEHLTVTLRVNGEDRTLEQSRVVSSRSYTERLESKWVEKEARAWVYTNSFWTNVIQWTNREPRPKHWPATNAHLMESPK